MHGCVCVQERDCVSVSFQKCVCALQSISEKICVNVRAKECVIE